MTTPTPEQIAKIAGWMGLEEVELKLAIDYRTETLVNAVSYKDAEAPFDPLNNPADAWRVYAYSLAQGHDVQGSLPRGGEYLCEINSVYCKTDTKFADTPAEALCLAVLEMIEGAEDA